MESMKRTKREWMNLIQKFVEENEVPRQYMEEWVREDNEFIKEKYGRPLSAKEIYNRKWFKEYYKKNREKEIARVTEWRKKKQNALNQSDSETI